MTSIIFEPFQSTCAADFWHRLAGNKLDSEQLQERAVSITGTYTSGSNPSMPARLSVDTNSFDAAHTKSDADVDAAAAAATAHRSHLAHGIIFNTNTLTGFKQFDKKALFGERVAALWRRVRDGSVLDDPSALIDFAVLSHADLKKFIFYYWFTFPALILDQKPFQCDGVPKSVSDALGVNTTERLRQRVRERLPSFFLLRVGVDDNDETMELNENMREWAGVYERADADEAKRLYVCAVDPCASPDAAGWPLRNLLVALAIHLPAKCTSMRLLCVREQFHGGAHSIERSIVFNVTELHGDAWRALSVDDVPKAVGWEKNKKGKLAPRHVNLSQSMDPTRLAATAVDLNLKLMRWRLLPNVDLEKIRDTKCLLLGAGTLGCNVARQLLSWGVRHVSFLDNGKVSYSNPVRQSLFEFKDCLEGGRYKAEAAADMLKRIFPDVHSEGHVMSIPMPGHSVADGDERKKCIDDVRRLTALVDAHDVVFLLMDSRESRWLPTLLCAAKRRLCMTAALGFDTFVVMRHGVTHVDRSAAASAAASADAHTDLGCYFCNDVVAPRDSLTDRTLDQQCTVTRPAMSMLASALCVELMVGVLHHERGAEAPGDEKVALGHACTTELGQIPHQVRGFLTHYEHLLLVGHQYDRCTACSQRVLSRFAADGDAFLLNVFNDPTYLEEVAGINELGGGDDGGWELGSDSEDDF